MSLSILQATASTDRRGAEIFGYFLGDALSERGHRVTTVALAPGKRSERLDLPTLGRSARSPATLRRLRQAFGAADVVVGHGSKTLSACALAGIRVGTPFVYRSIGDPRYWGASRSRRIRTGFFLRRAHSIAVVWPGAADALAALYGIALDRVRVIPRGVPGDQFRPMDARERLEARRRLGLDEGSLMVAYVGALSSEKGVANAIRAVAPLRDVRLVMAGDGPERDALASLADELAPGRITFLGESNDPAAVMAASDVLVLPSVTEGTPGVLIEAGLCGLPVVATDVGGVATIVVDQETGVLVPPGDVERLTDGLRSVLADGSELGRKARAHCLEHFEMNVVADAWETLLSSVVGRSTLEGVS